MKSTRGAKSTSSKLWMGWLVLAVMFGAGAFLALAKPWQSDPVAAPTAEPGVSASSDATPSPAALSASTAVLANPDGLEWTGEYTDDKAGTITGAYPPFVPDGDYPGTVHEVASDDGVPTTVEGAAPPWFPDMKAFSFADGEAEAIGDGVAMDAYLVDGGFLPAEAPDGTPTTWIVAAFNTDQHSDEPRWAICRFHLTGADATAVVDGVYCDQAETGPVGTTWAFNEYEWWLDGDTLFQRERPAWQELDPGAWPAPRSFSTGNGPGGVVLGGDSRATPTGPTASWDPQAVGLPVPSQSEVWVAYGCDVDEDGQLVHCPEG